MTFYLKKVIIVAANYLQEIPIPNNMIILWQIDNEPVAIDVRKPERNMPALMLLANGCLKNKLHAFLLEQTLWVYSF